MKSIEEIYREALKKISLMGKKNNHNAKEQPLYVQIAEEALSAQAINEDGFSVDDLKRDYDVKEFMEFLNGNDKFYVDEVRQWLRLYHKEEISFSRFVELFNGKLFKTVKLEYEFKDMIKSLIECEPRFIGNLIESDGRFEKYGFYKSELK